MVPPFLAYYAALTSNQTMMTDAYNQCKLYRQYLGSASGLWRHIQLGDTGQDPGNWGTGNAWAAAGMMRVLVTMKNSRMSSAFASQQTDLQTWIEEIMRGAFAHQVSPRHVAPFPLGFSLTHLVLPVLHPCSSRRV